ncbi:MAG: class I SAM-dependent methyltransferase [Hadesarchaea archaeon]|nr:class I SAM-dependent methyltransferase [Hadesarchaea archaeon]
MGKLGETSRAFDEFCDEYDAWYSSGLGKLVGRSELLAIRRLLPNGEGLEVGVGSGFFASGLGVKFGIDPSRRCLEKARARGIKVVLGAGEGLPFKGNSFDYVLYAATMCFLDDPATALREAARVLRPRGRVIICFIPKDSPWGEVYIRKKREGHKFYRHADFFTFAEVKALIERAGLRVEKVCSTLLQRPERVLKVERPIDGERNGAGFICIRAEKVTKATSALGTVSPDRVSDRSTRRSSRSRLA